MLSLRLLALVGLLSIVRAGYTGDGTAYGGDYQKDDTGKNACGFGNLGDHWEKYYAAMPSNCGNRGWSRGKCGQCVKIRGAHGEVVVKLIDQCASCSCGDVDLSSRALQAATGYGWDRKRIEWEWTSCSGGGAQVTSHKRTKHRHAKHVLPAARSPPVRCLKRLPSNGHLATPGTSQRGESPPSLCKPLSTNALACCYHSIIHCTRTFIQQSVNWPAAASVMSALCLSVAFIVW